MAQPGGWDRREQRVTEGEEKIKGGLLRKKKVKKTRDSKDSLEQGIESKGREMCRFSMKYATTFWCQAVTGSLDKK